MDRRVTLPTWSSPPIFSFGDDLPDNVYKISARDCKTSPSG